MPSTTSAAAGSVPRQRQRVTVADVVDLLAGRDLPLRVTAYDGTDVGPRDAPAALRVRSERGLRYLLTAPGDLGLARAYVSGDLELSGAHPGDPYEAMRLVHGLRLHRPAADELLRLARGLGWDRLRPPPPPPQEEPPRWRRAWHGAVHSRTRDARAVRHHYDVSNAFYERVLGRSMTYSCALWRGAASLEEAQAAKHELVCAKLGLRPGMRLLDVGCGWGAMVRHAAREHGVVAVGVTLSPQQAAYARSAAAREGLDGRVQVHLADYRDVEQSAFDAVSSIGMAEHVGLRAFPGYVAALRGLLRPGGRLLNHMITRADGRSGARPGAFVDRYVFPDGELPSPGRLVTEVHDGGFEVRHLEGLREHYPPTLAAWSRNLVESWDACVAEVGPASARVWGLYMAGSRLSFEEGSLQVHQVLAVR